MTESFQQQQIDTQDEAQVQLMKAHIDILFKTFEGVIDYLKEDEIEERHLLRLNDAAVANLNLFGLSCRSKDADKEILNVAHGHFTKKKEEMDRGHQRIVKPWLEYTECALLGNKLETFQISQVTLNAGRKGMKNPKNMIKFVDKLVAAEHVSYDTVKNAEENKKPLREQHAKEAKRNKPTYQQRKLMVKCPNQNSMYNIVGGGQNIQFGSPSLEIDEKDGANEEQKYGPQFEPMNVDQAKGKARKGKAKAGANEEQQSKSGAMNLAQGKGKARKGRAKGQSKVQSSKTEAMKIDQQRKGNQRKGRDKIEEEETQQPNESMDQDDANSDSAEPTLMNQNQYRVGV